MNRLRSLEKPQIPKGLGIKSYLIPISLFVGMLVVILAINTRAILLVAQKSGEHETLVRNAERAKELSLLTQIRFKKQVQEWKNVLIRGDDPALREKYFGQFEEREADVFAHLRKLQKLDVLSVEQRGLVQSLIDEVSRLGDVYRSALEDGDLSETNGYKNIDAHVLGIDRAPAQHMDSLVSNIHTTTLQTIAESASVIRSTRTAAIYQCFATALIGIFLVVYYVRERVAAERKMAEAIVKAQAGNESKGAFLANMSHETRTPLNGILGMAQLLEEQELTSEGRSYLATLKQSGEHLLGILTDIIDFSDIESEGFALEPREVEIRTFYSGLVSMFKAKAEQKGISLNLSLGAYLPETVRIDPVRVSRVLAHVIDNAVKFTDAGRVELSVSWREYGSGQPAMLHTEIEDTGAGIPKDRLGGLFDAFTQLDESHTREFGGTGLGLSICEALVHRMGGQIQASSTVGKGSIFVICLPVADWRFGTKTEIGDGSEMSGGVQVNLEEVPVLLVEDNKVNQRVAGSILERYGAAVTMASNGTEAVAHYERQKFPLIFMDLQMPQMDGFEATERIKALSASTAAPFIVALTATTSATDRTRADELGFDGFLNKPIEVTGLEMQISRFLGQYEKRAEEALS